MRAPIIVAGQDWSATEERGRLVYQDDARADRSAGAQALRPPPVRECRRSPSPRCARSACGAAGRRRSRAWPRPSGRPACSGWRGGKLAALLPPGSELWLDGGHNPDGGRVIASALADLEERVSRPLVLIVGMLANKDCDGFLRNFTGLARRIVTVPIPQQESSKPAAALAEAARAIGLPAQESPDLGTALAAIGAFALDQPPRILITGSLYLAGAALAQNGTPPE